MVKYSEIYKCEHCGNIVEILHDGAGYLSCCGTAIKLIQADSIDAANDAAKEKHVPVVEKTDNSCKISVGSVAHPMEEKHYIEWIEVLTDNKSCLRRLKPGEAPEAYFPTETVSVTVRAYCNLHGLWKADA
ncbi:MAG: desulfoferrodoxin [Desulfovibrio sp.]|jgi:superoxide reductase|nr:desulfoferrodoxin [Desulfovibrio sp.]